MSESEASIRLLDNLAWVMHNGTLLGCLVATPSIIFLKNAILPFSPFISALKFQCSSMQEHCNPVSNNSREIQFTLNSLRLLSSGMILTE